MPPAKTAIKKTKPKPSSKWQLSDLFPTTTTTTNNTSVEARLSSHRAYLPITTTSKLPLKTGGIRYRGFQRTKPKKKKPTTTKLLILAARKTRLEALTKHKENVALKLKLRQSDRNKKIWQPQLPLPPYQGEVKICRAVKYIRARKVCPDRGEAAR